MEIKIKLDVSAKSFFDLLSLSILHDIQLSVGDSFKIDDIIQNFTYKKKILNKFARPVEATVIINNFKSPSIYEATFSTTKGSNKISYIIENEEEGIIVKYSEVYFGINSFADLNHKFMSIFFKKANSKKIQNMLKMMEKYIIDNK